MADRFASTYRYVKKDGEGNPVSRVILSAGDKVPNDLDKKEVASLKKAGLIIDESRLSKDNMRLPYGHPDSVAHTATRNADEQNKEQNDEQNKAQNHEQKPVAKKTTASGS